MDKKEFLFSLFLAPNLSCKDLLEYENSPCVRTLSHVVVVVVVVVVICKFPCLRTVLRAKCTERAGEPLAVQRQLQA